MHVKARNNIPIFTYTLIHFSPYHNLIHFDNQSITSLFKLCLFQKVNTSLSPNACATYSTKAVPKNNRVGCTQNIVRQITETTLSLFQTSILLYNLSKRFFICSSFSIQYCNQRSPSSSYE